MSVLKQGSISVLVLSWVAIGTPTLVPRAGGTPVQESEQLPRTGRSQQVVPQTIAVSQPHLDRFGDPLPEGALFRLGTNRFRHAGSIIALAISPNGKILVTEGLGSLRFWDTATGKAGLVIPCETANYGLAQNRLAFASDGTKLLFATEGSVVALDLKTWQTSAVWSGGPKSKVRSVHISPDGRKVAIGTSDGVQLLELASSEVRWSTHNGADFLHFKETDDRLLQSVRPYSMALFSPDGKMVAINSGDAAKVLRLVEAGTGAEQRCLDLNARLVRMAFSSDGRMIATTERDNAVRVYETGTGKRLHDWIVALSNPHENFTSAIAFSPDGATLAAGATDNLVHLWDLRTGRELPPLQGHTWNISGLAFAPDGRWLYSSGFDGAMRSWDTTAWREGPIGGEAATGVVTYSPDGSLLAWEGNGGFLHLTDASNGKKLRTLPGNPSGFSFLAFSPNGSILAAAGHDMSIQLWDVSRATLLRQWAWPKGKDPHAAVNDMAFSKDGNSLVTAGFRTREVLAWDVPTGKRLGQATHTMANGVILSADARTAVSAGWDCSVRWWGMPDLRPLDGVTLPMGEKQLGGSPDTRFHAITASPDGRLLATLDLAGYVTLWGAANHKQLHSFAATRNQCNIAFSPDGQWIATGGWKGEVILWDVRSGKQVYQLAGHEARVFSVAFSPDGRTLLTGSDDSTGLVWDLRPKTAANPEPSLASLWGCLAGSDPAAAYKAIWHLADRPGPSIAFLRDKLKAVKPIDRRTLSALFERLDHDNFTDREAASKGLAVLGEQVEPDLRRELAQTSSPEKRRRLQALLDVLIPEGTSEDARAVRALVVMKWIKSSEARQLLAELSQGADGARLTQEAKIALRHLDHR